MKLIIRKLIVWALGGAPILRGSDPIHDAAALDKVIAEIKNP
jgi:hypothetical protein